MTRAGQHRARSPREQAVGRRWLEQIRAEIERDHSDAEIAAALADLERPRTSPQLALPIACTGAHRR